MATTLDKRLPMQERNMTRYSRAIHSITFSSTAFSTGNIKEINSSVRYSGCSRYWLSSWHHWDYLALLPIPQHGGPRKLVSERYLDLRCQRSSSCCRGISSNL